MDLSNRKTADLDIPGRSLVFLSKSGKSNKNEKLYRGANEIPLFLLDKSKNTRKAITYRGPRKNPDD